MAIIPAIAALLKGIIGKVAGSKLVGGAAKLVSGALGGVASKLAEAGAGKAATEGIKQAASGAASNGLKLGRLSDLVNVAKAEPINQALTSKSGVLPVVEQGLKNRVAAPTKLSKIANVANSVLFGEGFGSDVARRTLANAAQQGLFRGSDVGQPDKDFGGVLANSLLSGVAGAAVNTVQQQFDYKQQLQQMMNEFDPAEESFKTMQPAMLEQINSFRDYIVNVGMGKQGLQKGKYTSQEMLDITDRYNKLQRNISQYMGDLETYQKEYKEFYNNSTKYDPVDFKMRSDYFLRNGRMPVEGTTLTQAEVNPDTFFSNLSITNKDAWRPTSETNPYEMQSPLTGDQKKVLAGTYFNTNQGLQKYIVRNKLPEWKQQYAGDAELMNMFTNPETGQFDDMSFAEFMTGLEYGDKIEQNKVDWAKKAQYMEETSKKNESLPYRVVEDFPYSNTESGRALVFDKSKTANVPVSMLGDIQTDADVLPVNFEYVDKYGNLIGTTSVDEGNGTIRKQIKIPSGRAQGLLEAYFPGITKSIPTQTNPSPVGVQKSNEVKGFDTKTNRMAIFDATTHEFLRWE
jgi:hypothetical protein